jgi:hypothetical protein
MWLTLGGPHRNFTTDTGDIPHHSLLNVWRLRGHTHIGRTNLQDPPLCMMGQGIPAPMPSDTNRDVGRLPPVPSVHRRVTDRSKSGRRRTSSDCNTAHKYAWRTALPPAQAPTWALGQSNPSGLRGVTGHLEPEGRGRKRPLSFRGRGPFGGTGPTVCTTQEGLSFPPRLGTPRGFLSP